MKILLIAFLALTACNANTIPPHDVVGATWMNIKRFEVDGQIITLPLVSSLPEPIRNGDMVALENIDGAFVVLNMKWHHIEHPTAPKEKE